MSYDYTRFGGMDALPTPQSQLESLQRLLAEKEERIQALEQQNAALERALADLVEYCTTGDEGRVEALGRTRILVGNKNFPEARTDEQRSQDVQKLVDAAREVISLLGTCECEANHCESCKTECKLARSMLTEALKPFE